MVIKKKTYFVDIDGTIFKYRDFDTYLDTCLLYTSDAADE